MTTAKEDYNKICEIMQRGLALKEQAQHLLGEAYHIARIASKRLRRQHGAEPVRGVLYLMAAQLAIETRDIQGATTIIVQALEGEKHMNPETADRLKGLYRRIIDAHLNRPQQPEEQRIVRV